ncbi:hypothetical protein B0T24DRAFT_610532 [Lasiosphaeria ovina]|uniref:TRP C-terminal domain-containing protein n=1 Tax=Lasiosphaeria ovina TaxID=92902 RepID=A0AAE0KNA8_9PEZI|nr:hypothetical protein B0T24DRAFT_610532 [Lasiosphaeria ovina]
MFLRPSLVLCTVFFQLQLQLQVTLAELDSSLSDSGATLTTLPPAQPTGTDACAFDSLNSLVDRVASNWTGYNISLLVQTCPGVCNLVYGVGNPDISGIGAMISYALQGATSIIFGPLLGVLALYMGADPSFDTLFSLPAQLWVAKYFFPVANSIHQANIVTAFSVLLAADIRTQNVSPVAEREFLQQLAAYEFVICLICTLSYLPIHSSSPLKKAVMMVYVLATAIMLIAASTWTYNDYGPVLEAITNYCVRDRDWPVPGIPIAQHPTKPEPNPKEESPPPSFWVSILAVISFGVAGVVGLFVLGLLAFVLGWFVSILIRSVLYVLSLSLQGPYLATTRLLRVGPRRMGILIMLVLLSAVWIFVVWLALASFISKRQRLRALAGALYQDNEWGFGQITALLTWLPVFQDTLFALIATIRYFLRRRDRVAEAAELELEPLVPDSENQASSSVRNSEGNSPDMPPPDTEQSGPESQTNKPGLARTSSADVQMGTLQPRPTWPRNDGGTYLPA